MPTFSLSSRGRNGQFSLITTAASGGSDIHPLDPRDLSSSRRSLQG